MKLAFRAIPGKMIHQIKLFYHRDHYSFGVEALPAEIEGCVCLNEVQLHTDNLNRVRCVSGYCPYQSWNSTTRSPPESTPGLLKLETKIQIVPGTGITLDGEYDRWIVSKNSEGWICIGDPIHSGSTVITFSIGCVAALQDKSLIALWLNPVFVEE